MDPKLSHWASSSKDQHFRFFIYINKVLQRGLQLDVSVLYCRMFTISNGDFTYFAFLHTGIKPLILKRNAIESFIMLMNFKVKSSRL